MIRIESYDVRFIFFKIIYIFVVFFCCCDIVNYFSICFWLLVWNLGVKRGWVLVKYINGDGCGIVSSLDCLKSY